MKHGFFNYFLYICAQTTRSQRLTWAITTFWKNSKTEILINLVRFTNTFQALGEAVSEGGRIIHHMASRPSIAVILESTDSYWSMLQTVGLAPPYPTVS